MKGGVLCVVDHMAVVVAVVVEAVEAVVCVDVLRDFCYLAEVLGCNCGPFGGYFLKWNV